MRLIDSSSYELHEFYEKQIPRYAILSHRWEEDGEVSFQDLSAGRGPEMREAINSMFEWYRRAEVCYAYLSDVDSSIFLKSAVEQDFKRSAWFTRGWTLQELLAPQWVEFYDINWQEIGTKSSLAPLIKSITGISHLFNYADASIAQKMCWASLRQTTRVEDQAYCLLGIFGVHMPPLYGEGANAFHRLQLEIISQSDDESIFAWEGRSNVIAGLLASSPRQFQFSGSVVRLGFDQTNPHMKRQPYSMTNQGLRLELLLRQTSGKPLAYGKRSKRTFVAPLNCAWESEDAGFLSFVGLPLCRDFYDAELPLDGLRNWFRQGKLEKFNNLDAGSLENKTIFAEILKTVPVFSRPQCVVVKLSSPWEPPFTVRRRIEPHSDAIWSSDRSEGEVLKSFYKGDEIGALIYQDQDSAFAVVLGSSSFVFWIDIIVEPETLNELDISPQKLLASFERPGTSRGAGDRILKKLSDGRVVSAQTKKELCAATYRFVVDVAISQSGKAKPGDLQFSQFHNGELNLGGGFW
ncbi:hypothetical protein VTL71DRAFT_1963 [Oculimacula yallundae]|uniref:Uncharacterized protein n=1 Tax=Oculimacula yallundae TaxID=86028 RepID=A0ABR4CEL2_9HELO